MSCAVIRVLLAHPSRLRHLLSDSRTFGVKIRIASRGKPRILRGRFKSWAPTAVGDNLLETTFDFLNGTGDFDVAFPDLDRESFPFRSISGLWPPGFEVRHFLVPITQRSWLGFIGFLMVGLDSNQDRCSNGIPSPSSCRCLGTRVNSCFLTIGCEQILAG